MLILHTPKGKIPIAKDNIHTIHEEDRGPFLKPRLIYVTRDLIGIPFTKINGKRVKDVWEALELIGKYADDEGLKAIDQILTPEQFDEYFIKPLREETEQKQETELQQEPKQEPKQETKPEQETNQETKPSNFKPIIWPKKIFEEQYIVKIPYSLLLTTKSDKLRLVKNNIHILQEDKQNQVYYIDNDFDGRYHSYKEPIPIKAINGILVTSAKQSMEIIKDASKPFNRLKNSTKRTFNKLKNDIKRRTT